MMENTLYFPSYAEFIQRSEMVRSRQERLIQVRQHEKNMAAKFREKMRNQAQEQYESTEKYIMNEICELHSKELAAMRRVYEECITKINEEHYTKMVQSKTTNNRTDIHLPHLRKNLLLKKNSSPVKTIVICEDFPRPCNSTAVNEGRMNRGQENINHKPQKRNPSPVKKSSNIRITNENQNKMEARTKSIYHEQCVPDLVKNMSSKKENFSVKSSETTPNLIVVNEDQIIKVTNPVSSFVQKSTEDFLDSYIQRVHDRIRILEQKEKMLHRRTIFLPEFNHPTIISMTKNSPAETNVEVTIEKPEPTESREPVIAKPSVPLSPNRDPNINLISKQVRNTAVQTSRSCRKKKRHCKRASLTKNEDLIIVIRNQQNEISNATDNDISRDVAVEQTSNTSRETESSVSEAEKLSLSVKKIVRATTDKYKDYPRLKKLDNWRQLFRNKEKLSESSYYSPPDPTKKYCSADIAINYSPPGPVKDTGKPVKSKKKVCKRRLLRKSAAATDESDKDIGYYVAKLLLMSPKSMENLHNLSEETITSISVDEIEYEKSESQYVCSDDGGEKIDEEEFIRRMLAVSIPNSQIAAENAVLHEAATTLHGEPQISVSPDKSATITETDMNSETSSMTISENDDTKLSKLTYYNDDVLKGFSMTDLKLDSRLSGWIGASIRRTLEASAVNSTSSYDEYDNVRQVDQVVRSLIEKNEYFLTGEKSSSSPRLSFSPVEVPNIRLNIPQMSGTST